MIHVVLEAARSGNVLHQADPARPKCAGNAVEQRLRIGLIVDRIERGDEIELLRLVEVAKITTIEPVRLVPGQLRAGARQPGGRAPESTLGRVDRRRRGADVARRIPVQPALRLATGPLWTAPGSPQWTAPAATTSASTKRSPSSSTAAVGPRPSVPVPFVRKSSLRRTAANCPSEDAEVASLSRCANQSVIFTPAKKNRPRGPVGRESAPIKGFSSNALLMPP